jgi:hypothetical protein
MPAKDFRAGKPRNGQWVWVEKDGKSWLAICQGPDHGHYGSVLDPLSGEVVVKTFPPQAAILDFKGKPDWFCVTLVHEQTGLEDIITVLVPIERLKPVLKREDIPAPRLATMRPDWFPVA